MLKPEIEKALNDQLNWEQTASQEYLAMSAWFENLNLKGFARFMRKQSDEEREHALRIFDHIVERGGRVTLAAVAAPPVEFDSPRGAFEAAFKRERSNTESIHALYKLALDHHDYPTQTMLHWFIDEQVEEEAWCDEARSLLDMVGDNRSALLMLDKRYGQKADEE